MPVSKDALGAPGPDVSERKSQRVAPNWELMVIGALTSGESLDALEAADKANLPVDLTDPKSTQGVNHIVTNNLQK